MCSFLSGITFGPKLENKFGRHYSNPCVTNSHSEMERALKLPAKNDSHWAKWEFTPTGRLWEFDKYQFWLDEDRTPDWWTDDLEHDAIEYAKSLLAKVVLVEGVIEELREPVYALCGSVVVNRLYSQVREMRDSSQVRAMWESSQVGVMWNSSQVGVMRDSSQVREMWGSSQVGVMRDSSQVREMWGSSQVGVMWGSSQVGVMRDSSQVREMWGSSQVGVMRDSSQVREMWGSSQVDAMWNSSQVTVLSARCRVRLYDQAILIDRSRSGKVCAYTAADLPDHFKVQEVPA